jgi:citrate lyase subunit beta/citryl-CoA lyase
MIDVEGEYSMTPRSYLYIPGNQPRFLASALERGADALIVDLEDAVPLAGKDAAREAVGQWLAGLPRLEAEIWVRVNPGERGLADVRALANAATGRLGGGPAHGGAALAGFCLAKADSAADVAEVAAALDALGSPAALLPLLESAAGVLRAAHIARAPRVRRLQLGEADLCADAGIEPGADERELLFARSSVVLASAAAGIEPPVAPVSTDFRDLDALAASTRSLRRLGFFGRACIHPAQLPVANQVFTPTRAELDAAADVVSRHAAAGGGVAVAVDGRMIDEAVVRWARRLLGTNA